MKASEILIVRLLKKKCLYNKNSQYNARDTGNSYYSAKTDFLLPIFEKAHCYAVFWIGGNRKINYFIASSTATEEYTHWKERIKAVHRTYYYYILPLQKIVAFSPSQITFSMIFLINSRLFSMLSSAKLFLR